MFENFTDRSRKVMRLSDQESKRLGYPLIEPDHILYGLLLEGAGVAAHVLKDEGIDNRAVKDFLEAKLKERRQEQQRVFVAKIEGGSDFDLQKCHGSTKRVLEYALHSTKDLGHEYIGTEHLLMGLIREYENNPADYPLLEEIFDKHKIKLSKIRDSVLEFLGVKIPTPEEKTKPKIKMTVKKYWRVPKETMSLEDVLEKSGYKISETGRIKINNHEVGEITKDKETGESALLVVYSPNPAEYMQITHAIGLRSLLAENDIPYSEHPASDMVVTYLKEFNSVVRSLIARLEEQ